jgi:hypothetical protein
MLSWRHPIASRCSRRSTNDSVVGHSAFAPHEAAVGKVDLLQLAGDFLGRQSVALPAGSEALAEDLLRDIDHHRQVEVRSQRVLGRLTQQQVVALDDDDVDRRRDQPGAPAMATRTRAALGRFANRSKRAGIPIVFIDYAIWKPPPPMDNGAGIK